MVVYKPSVNCIYYKYTTCNCKENIGTLKFFKWELTYKKSCELTNDIRSSFSCKWQVKHKRPAPPTTSGVQSSNMIQMNLTKEEAETIKILRKDW